MRSFFNLGMVLGGLAIAVILASLAIALLWFTRPGPRPVGASTAVLQVIEAPTMTPIPPTPLPEVTPTGFTQANTGSGEIEIGTLVQVSGTGGDGLRLRMEPGLNSQVRLLGSESEVFQVSDGPRDQDGYIWWYLVGPDDPTRHGWAVSDFLIQAEPQ
ncbi:MAG TPA: hypothetical protein VLS48_03005 [Anaerolineales bacterium]|nr:hypothetical protein [Anaerolineales bacterium]